MSVLFSPSSNPVALFFALSATSTVIVLSIPSMYIIATTNLTTAATIPNTILIVPRITEKRHAVILYMKTCAQYFPVFNYHIVGTSDGGWISINVSCEPVLDVGYDFPITVGVTTDYQKNGQV